MKTVSITEARNRFADLVSRAAYGSEQIIIEKMGRPIVALVSVDMLNAARKKPGVKKPPSATAGTIAIGQSININRVFDAIKEPYDQKSLLGR